MVKIPAGLKEAPPSIRESGGDPESEQRNSQIGSGASKRGPRPSMAAPGLRKGSRRPPRRPRFPKSGPMTLGTLSRQPRMPPRRAQEAPKRPQESSKRRAERAPRCQNRCFSFVFPMFFAFSLFRLSDAPRRPRRPPRDPQDGPRGPQGGPMTAQEGPKTAQEAPKGAP